MEPERPIEKLLRAAAEERRKTTGPSLEMHPATRRLLQSEIARRWSAESERPVNPEGARMRFFRGPFQRRFVGAALALLVVLAALWIPGWHESSNKREMKMAKDLSQAAGPRQFEPPPVAQPPALSGASLSSAASTGSAGVLAGQFPPARESIPSDALAIKPSVPLGSQYRTEDTTGRASNFATPGAIPAQPDAALPSQQNNVQSPMAGSSVVALSKAKVESRGAEGRSTGAESKSVEQNFVRLDSLAKTLSDRKIVLSARNVLTSFSFQQSGHLCRIVDGDGSVYTGTVELAQNAAVASPATTSSPPALRVPRSFAAPTPAAAETGAVATAGQSEPVGPVYSFKVSGTNRSLNQLVVFSGVMRADRSESAAYYMFNDLGNNFDSARVRSRSASQSPQPPPKPRIIGKALVGSGTEVEINAQHQQ
jgi:hypothetical protein